MLSKVASRDPQCDVELGKADSVASHAVTANEICGLSECLLQKISVGIIAKARYWKQSQIVMTSAATSTLYLRFVWASLSRSIPIVLETVSQHIVLSPGKIKRDRMVLQNSRHPSDKKLRNGIGSNAIAANVAGL